MTGMEPRGGLPLRVSTLELFFDLVFVAAALAAERSVAADSVEA